MCEMYDDTMIHKYLLVLYLITIYGDISCATKVLGKLLNTSGYATWFTAGGAICITHYDVIDEVITRKL